MGKTGVVLLLSCALTMSRTGAAQHYTITDLGPLAPTGINSWAQVVGNYNNQAYVWSLGRMRPLGLLPSGTFSRAASINDLGTITGTADGVGTVFAVFPWDTNMTCSNGLVQPFVWTPSTGIQGLGIIDVPGENYPTLDPCAGQFYATDVNANGQVVGYTQQFPDLFQWGFSWTRASGMTFFGGSWAPTYVLGISNTGQIVGEDRTDATSWIKGIATDLIPIENDNPLGEYISSASAVNDVGQIVGWSTMQSMPIDGCYDVSIYNPRDPGSPNCPIHASLWASDGTVTDLGTLPNDTLSSASKINPFGLVIGSSGNTAVYEDGVLPRGPIKVIGHPFIWSGRTGMRDLNTLIPKNSGWVIQSATDINTWGQIVGSGTRNGESHGYMLTPLNPFEVF
jgi:uncharacterized membrane protein